MGYYYSPFVSHCVRFYAKFPNATRFASNVDKRNWEAVKKTLDKYPHNEATMLVKVYDSGNIECNINSISRKIGMDKSSFWKIIRSFEHSVAKNRGIVC